jgi:hypothetical protein
MPCVVECGGAFLPVIPALNRLRQEDHEFKASLGSIAKLCLKRPKKKPPVEIACATLGVLKND